MKLQRKVKVRNALGLHTRPAAMIVKLLQSSRSTVTFTYRDETVNARSIMSILMLAARKNAGLVVTVEGADAEGTMERLIRGFEEGFGEP